MQAQDAADGIPHIRQQVAGEGGGAGRGDGSRPSRVVLDVGEPVGGGREGEEEGQAEEEPGGGALYLGDNPPVVGGPSGRQHHRADAEEEEDEAAVLSTGLVVAHQHRGGQAGEAEGVAAPSARHEGQQQTAREPRLRHQAAAVEHTEHDAQHRRHQHPLHGAAAEEVSEGGDQVAPSYKAQNAPPAGDERLALHIAPHHHA